MTHPVINPIATVNPEAYNAEFSTACNLGLGALEERVTSLRGDLDIALAQAGDNFDIAKVINLKGDTTQATLGNMVDHHSRLSAAQECFDQMRSIRAAALRRGARPDRDPEEEIDRLTLPTARSRPLHEHIHAALKAAGFDSYAQAARMNASLNLDLGRDIVAATITRTAGFAPEETRAGRVEPLPSAQTTLLDMVPIGRIGVSSYRYMQESGGSITARTSAATRAEAAKLAQSTLTWSEVNNPVESIGTIIPVTYEQLDDVMGMEGLIDGRLRNGVRQQVNNQIIGGNGTTPNLKGFAGYFDAGGGAPAADELNQHVMSLASVTVASWGKDLLIAVRKAITQIQKNGATMPDAAVLETGVAEAIALAETTSAGFYMGDPRFFTGERVWGLPVVLDQYELDVNYQTDADSATAGNQPEPATADDEVALIGNFREFCELHMRHDMRVEFGLNSSDFERLQQSARAYVRCAFAVYRTKAFCDIRVEA